MSADQAVPAALPPAGADAPSEQGVKVFAGNLAYSTDDAALRAFFAPVENDIVNVQIIKRGHRSAGYGFVAVKDQAAAEKAVAELDKKELDGRPVIVEVAKPNEHKQRVRNNTGRPKKRTGGRRGDKPVPGEVTEAEANGEPAPAARIDDAGETTGGEGAGPAKPRKKRFNKKRKPKATSTEGAPAADASAAHVNGNTDTPAAAPEGTERRPRRPRPRVPRAPREAPTGPPSKTVLFVANLAFNVDEEALTKAFVDEGIKVTTARVVRRRWGNPRRSKGYGFVDVGSEEEQQKAIGIVQGKEIEGRPITVKIAVDSDRENKATDDEQAPAAAPA